MKKLLIVAVMLVLIGCGQESKTQAAESVVMPQKIEVITHEMAKNKAERLLLVMNKVENVATLDVVLNGDGYWKNFAIPLNNEIDSWPTPWYAPENKEIEPYQLCNEAALALSFLAEARKRTGDSRAPDVVKWRDEYRDKKGRCEITLKT